MRHRNAARATGIIVLLLGSTVMPERVQAQTCVEIDVGQFRCGNNGQATSTVFAPGSRIIRPREVFRSDDVEDAALGPATGAATRAVSLGTQGRGSGLRFASFAEVFGVRQSQDATDREVASETATTGALVGFSLGDARYVVSFGVDYLDETFEFDGGERARSAVGLNASAVMGLGQGWAAFGSLRVARSDLDIRRDTLFREDVGFYQFTEAETGGETDARSVSALIGASHVRDLGMAWFGSVDLSVSYEREEIDGYQEALRDSSPEFWNEGDPTLRFEDDTRESLQFQLGGELARRIQTTNAILVPSLRGAYIHEFRDDARDIEATTSERYTSFLGGEETLTFSTSDPDRDFFLVGLGIEVLPHAGDWGISAGYTRLVGHDYREEETLSAFVWTEF